MIGDYQVITELGSGATGPVYLSRTNSGQKVAQKLLKFDPQNARFNKLHQNMLQESAMLQRLDHPNVMKILDAQFDVQWTDRSGRTQTGDFIVTELCPNGELFEFVQSPRGPFSEPIAKAVFK